MKQLVDVWCGWLITGRSDSWCRSVTFVFNRSNKLNVPNTVLKVAWLLYVYGVPWPLWEYFLLLFLDSKYHIIYNVKITIVIRSAVMFLHKLLFFLIINLVGLNLVHLLLWNQFLTPKTHWCDFSYLKIFAAEFHEKGLLIDFVAIYRWLQY